MSERSARGVDERWRPGFAGHAPLEPLPLPFANVPADVVPLPPTPVPPTHRPANVQVPPSSHLRVGLQAAVQEVSEPAALPQNQAAVPATHPMPMHQPPHALDESLAAADLVICQTGCISHDDYWRVQDHCRRTGKPCILVDQAALPCAAQGTGQPVVVVRLAGGGRSALPHAMLHAGQD